MYIADTKWSESNWNHYAGIYTVSDEDESHDSMTLILGRNSHKDARIIFDNVQMQSLPRNCSNMLQNGDFEFGDSSFWRQNYGIDRFELIDNSNHGTSGDYSLRYNQKDSNGFYNKYVYQVLESRCFVEGQQFRITAQFKMLNYTSDEPFDCNVDSTCPRVYLRGKYEFVVVQHLILLHWTRLTCFYIGIGNDCSVNNGYKGYKLKNDNEGWIADEFNPYSYDFTVNSDLASCSTFLVGLGLQTPAGISLLIDKIYIGHLSTLSPTVSCSIPISITSMILASSHIIIILLGCPNLSSDQRCSSSNYSCSYNGIKFAE